MTNQDNSWMTDDEIVSFVYSKTDCTSLEYELASRLEAALDELEAELIGDRVDLDDVLDAHG